MEEAFELVDDRPLSFKTRSEKDYIDFLWDAFETNYTHGKYQFAFWIRVERKISDGLGIWKEEKRGFENYIMRKWIC